MNGPHSSNFCLKVSLILDLLNFIDFDMGVTTIMHINKDEFSCFLVKDKDVWFGGLNDVAGACLTFCLVETLTGSSQKL